MANLEHIERDHGDVSADSARMMEAAKDLDMDGAFETLNFADHPLFKNPAMAPVFQRLGKALRGR